MGWAGFSGREHRYDGLSMEFGNNGGGIRGTPGVLVRPKCLTGSSVECCGAYSRAILCSTADVDNELIIINERVRSVAKEILGNAVVTRKISFPENLAGFKIEAVKHRGDSNEVDAAVLDDWARAGTVPESVAISIFDGVGEGPEALAGLWVVAVECLL